MTLITGAGAEAGTRGVASLGLMSPCSLALPIVADTAALNWPVPMAPMRGALQSPCGPSDGGALRQAR